MEYLKNFIFNNKIYMNSLLYVWFILRGFKSHLFFFLFKNHLFCPRLNRPLLLRKLLLQALHQAGHPWLDALDLSRYRQLRFYFVGMDLASGLSLLLLRCTSCLPLYWWPSLVLLFWYPIVVGWKSLLYSLHCQPIMALWPQECTW